MFDAGQTFDAESANGHETKAKMTLTTLKTTNVTKLRLRRL